SRSLRQYAPERIDDERLTPETQLPFRPDAIDDDDEDAVRNRVPALNGLPSRVLRRIHLGFFAGQPTDGRRVEEKLRARKRRQTRRFGKPLIPTDERAHTSILRLVTGKAQVTRREIEFLVVERIIRDVHLAILARDASVCINH